MDARNDDQVSLEHIEGIYLRIVQISFDDKCNLKNMAMLFKKHYMLYLSTLTGQSALDQASRDILFGQISKFKSTELFGTDGDKMVIDAIANDIHSNGELLKALANRDDESIKDFVDRMVQINIDFQSINSKSKDTLPTFPIRTSLFASERNIIRNQKNNSASIVPETLDPAYQSHEVVVLNIPVVGTRETCPDFTGFAEELALLENLSQQKILITGAPGSGKSALVDQYALNMLRLHQADQKLGYARVFIIDVDTDKHSGKQDTVLNFFKLLARELGFKTDGPEQIMVGAVYQKLEAWAPYLMIFDGAQEFKDVQPFLPKCRHIITSRNPNFANTYKPVLLDGLSLQDSRTYLLNTLSNRYPNNPPCNTTDVDNFCLLIGCHPQTLAQSVEIIADSDNDVSAIDLVGCLQHKIINKTSIWDTVVEIGAQLALVNPIILETLKVCALIAELRDNREVEMKLLAAVIKKTNVESREHVALLRQYGVVFNSKNPGFICMSKPVCTIISLAMTAEERMQFQGRIKEAIHIGGYDMKLFKFVSATYSILDSHNTKGYK